MFTFLKKRILQTQDESLFRRTVSECKREDISFDIKQKDINNRNSLSTMDSAKSFHVQTDLKYLYEIYVSSSDYEKALHILHQIKGDDV